MHVSVPGTDLKLYACQLELQELEFVYWTNQRLGSHKLKVKYYYKSFTFKLCVYTGQIQKTVPDSFI